MKYVLMLFLFFFSLISLYSYAGIIIKILERELLIDIIMSIDLFMNVIKEREFLNYLDKMQLLKQFIF